MVAVRTAAPARSGTKASGLPRAYLAQIHVAKKALNMQDEDYRSMLRRVAGVDSSRDLSLPGFKAVMGEFNRLGFVSTAKQEAGKESTRAGWAATYAQKKKIAGMWEAYKGAPDPDGLRRWLEGHFKVSDLRFVSAELAPKIIYAINHFPAKRQAGTGAAQPN